MFMKWCIKQARDDIDKCAQDLFEVRLRLEMLLAAETADQAAIVKEKSLVDGYTEELAELKQEWSERTRRLYRPKYTPDWRVIANGVKETANWTCQSCGAVLELGPHRKLLHVHHINRITTDNCPENLVPLCAICHEGQEAHDGIRYSKEALAVIEKCRPKKC